MHEKTKFFKSTSTTVYTCTAVTNYLTNLPPSHPYTIPPYTPTYLGLSSHAATESSKRHYLLLLHDVIEVSDSFPQVHALDGLCRLASVLEMDSQLHSARLTC